MFKSFKNQITQKRRCFNALRKCKKFQYIRIILYIFCKYIIFTKIYQAAQRFYFLFKGKLDIFVKKDNKAIEKLLNE